MIRRDLELASGDSFCAAWWYVPDASERRPFIVMAHGLGATRECRLDAYARRFCEAGYCVLVFDYRHYGASGGEPRELLSVSRQREDYRAALAFARTLPEADPARAVLWGTSFSGGHVLALAAEELGISAAIAQVPFASGRKTALALSPRSALALNRLALADVASKLLKRSPVYLKLLGRTGEPALMEGDEHDRGYRSLLPPELEREGRWRNRAAARIALAVPFLEPAKRLSEVRVPILIIVGASDTLTPARWTKDAAARCKTAEVLTYPGGHFDYYEGSGLTRIVADELAFLSKHVPLGASARVDAPSHVEG